MALTGAGQATLQQQEYRVNLKASTVTSTLNWLQGRDMHDYRHSEQQHHSCIRRCLPQHLFFWEGAGDAKGSKNYHLATSGRRATQHQPLGRKEQLGNLHGSQMTDHNLIICRAFVFLLGAQMASSASNRRQSPEHITSSKRQQLPSDCSHKDIPTPQQCSHWKAISHL